MTGTHRQVRFDTKMELQEIPSTHRRHLEADKSPLSSRFV